VLKGLDLAELERLVNATEPRNQAKVVAAYRRSLRRRR
jgi:hypothetical protein